MTTSSHPVSEELLREIIAGTEGVTPGPWKVYDGCSWRRIGTAPTLGRDYDDCAVLYPNVASDGCDRGMREGGGRCGDRR